MLPEEGGGAAIAVAASENHTAVVTKEGALFTWGASYKKEVLGHEGVRWQPCPKRVAGVSRAVGLAAAKEHTILLVGATFPPIPSPYQRTPESTVPKLDLLAAQETAKHVDLFNALPLLMMSQRTSSEFLESYCREFIRLNLDGVLNLAQKSVLDIYLKEELANGLLLLDEDAQDGREMPFIIDVVLAGRRKDMPKASHQSEAVLSDPIQWIHACQDSIAEDELFADLQERFNRLQLTSSPPESNIIWTRTRSSSSIGSKSEAFAKSGRERSTSSTERCIMLTTNMDLSTMELAQEKHESISKEIRGLKKKLTQLAKLEALYPRGKSEDGSLLSTEQQDKIARRTQLESELSIFEPALANVKKAILEFSCKPNDEDTKMYSKKKTPKKPFGDKGEDTPDQDGAPEQETFCCEDCKVTCPDQRSYALHLNGRKHRNRIAQLEEEKKKNTAELMMKQRHLQQMEAMMNPTEPMVSSATVASAWGKCNAQSAVRSKYTLPPPPNAAQEIVPEAKPGPSPATLLSSTKSLKEIMEEEQRNAIQQKNPKKKGKAAKMALQLPSGSAPTMKSPPWTVKSQATPASPGFAHHQVPLLYSNKGSPWQASALPSTPLQPSPSSTPAMKSPPWAAKSPKSVPVASAPLPEFPSADPTPSPKGISSFGDFLNKVPVTPQQRPHSSSAPWAKAAPVSKPRPIGELTPTDKAKANVASTPTVRFQEIQKEEEEFKNVQDQSYTDNGKWFIGRRERAGSFASIQEIATQEREHQLLVEEQKRIEEQILREVAMAKKKQEQKQRQKAKKKAAQQKGKKQTSGNTVEEPGQPQQPSNKEKTGGNQKRRPNKRNQGRKQPQTTQNRGPDSASKGPDRSI